MDIKSIGDLNGKDALPPIALMTRLCEECKLVIAIVVDEGDTGGDDSVLIHC